ncbi:winged helix-turn-helix transcriptional regulator [Streptoalloteichus hindustanus]|uniref:Transcriptional regulator, HxlR family n=1 Tax=Streptoalloteichus hindustanus TaxID=2017 RepID=A0A1M4XT78_STRHI|nr:helix-turn-helix domain-containing protein [Streptoalloteichus hindustanus]SHE96483.1 transcriptional regulator, HxlR family [Streptoalloteichus hindustanus]
MSEDGRDDGHQTETHGWDPELVPDGRGRTRRPEAECPVEVALAAVAGRWTTLVVRELSHGPWSFGELRERLPDLSAKILTERLRELEARGLVVREQLAGFPVRTRYALSPAGALLRPLLIQLYATGAALLEARTTA